MKEKGIGKKDEEKRMKSDKKRKGTDMDLQGMIFWPQVGPITKDITILSMFCIYSVQ
jgi:hypothetical protein